MISFSSSQRVRGMISVIGWPMASACEYPNIRSALLFQLVIVPSSFLLMIASSEESTMAASSRLAGGGAPRCVRAFAPETVDKSASAMGLEDSFVLALVSGWLRLGAGLALPGLIAEDPTTYLR